MFFILICRILSMKCNPEFTSQNSVSPGVKLKLVMEVECYVG